MELTKHQQRWIDALRSGQYKQGVGRLCTVNDAGEQEWCCWGVASGLFAEELGYDLVWENNIDGVTVLYVVDPDRDELGDRIRHYETPPDAISEAVNVVGKRDMMTFANYNDDEQTFEFIADELIKYWEKKDAA